MEFDSSQYRFKLGQRISNFPTHARHFDDPKRAVRGYVKRLSEQQERLYADNRFALLVVFQGMDAAGKDSTIKNVFSGVNPQGFQVWNFKAPTYRELDHNYLWRYWQRLPQRGRIGVYNRSHYEEALVVRVHPEIIEGRQLPHKEINDHFWQRRFRDFVAMEEHLADNGTEIVKFFLNVSKEEQKKRFLKRLHRPEKHWKFSHSDLDERQHWDEYQHAFQEVLAHTHSERNPWYVIPADHKWTMRAIVADVIAERLEGLGLEWPKPNPADVARFDDAMDQLMNEDD